VPSRELDELQLVDVVAARIPNRLANQLIRSLGAHMPIPALKHLKRVRKLDNQADHLDIILCPPITGPARGDGIDQLGIVSGMAAPGAMQSQATASDSATRPASTDMLPAEVGQLVSQHNLELFMVQVPALAAQTRGQWEQWSVHWPMAYKVPDGKAPPSGDELLASAADQAYFEQQMAAVISMARAAGACNAARIVDPVSKVVIAEGVDCRHEHPLDHAAMVAVRAAAARDLTLWPPEPSSPPDEQQPAQPSSSQHPPAADGSPSHMSLPKRQKLGDGVAQAGVSARGQEGGGSSLPGEGIQGESRSGVSVLPKPYMCTGYDCFLVSEPCIMCAMGLVHSRLARVIYCHADVAGGALGGRTHLMKQRSLNHHYQAYHVALDKN